MYERFTDRARKVMQLANQEAQRFHHEYIGTEHILLGVIKEGTGVAANVLKNLDIDLRKIRLEVEKLIQSGPEPVRMGKLPQTPRAKNVIQYAMEEARNLSHNYVGTEHILLGLLREEEGVAAQVLMNLGLKLETVRAEILNLLGPAVTSRTTAMPTLAADPLKEKPVEAVQDVPAVCPKCGSSQVVRILWNRLYLYGKDHEDVFAGRAILGGSAGGNTPSWACLGCEPRWSEVHRLALQDYQWELAKKEAVASEDYETAIRLRDAQRELRPRLTALVQQLLARP